MVCYYPNCRIEIYEPSESPELDCYTGEPMDTWDLVTITDADFQPTNDDDVQSEWGKELKDLFKVYVEEDTPITDKSRIKIVGETPTYDVIGSPQRWNRFHHFLKVIVQIQRQPTL